jgi:hypothetical protein
MWRTLDFLVTVGLIDPGDASEMRRASRSRMSKVWYDVMTTKQRRRQYRFSARELAAMLPVGAKSTQMPEEMRDWLVGLGEMQERGELQQPLRAGLEERRLMTGGRTVANIQAEEARMEKLMTGLPREFLTRPYKKPKKKKSEGGKTGPKGKGRKHMATKTSKCEKNKKKRGKRKGRAEADSDSCSESGSSSSSSEDEDNSSTDEGGDDNEYKGKGMMLFNLERAPDTPISPDQVLEIWPMQIMEVGGIMIQRRLQGWQFSSARGTRLLCAAARTTAA